jgi:hypothetical protein
LTSCISTGYFILPGTMNGVIGGESGTVTLTLTPTNGFSWGGYDGTPGLVAYVQLAYGGGGSCASVQGNPAPGNNEGGSNFFNSTTGSLQGPRTYTATTGIGPQGQGYNYCVMVGSLPNGSGVYPSGSYTLQYSYPGTSPPCVGCTNGPATDGPIPLWALVSLGSGLVAIASRKLRRRPGNSGQDNQVPRVPH